MTGATDADLVRRAYDAWNQRGLMALEPFTAETVELEDAPEMPDAGTWRGRAEVMRRLAEVAGATGGRWVDLRDVRAVGGAVVVDMMWQMDRSPESSELGQVFHVVSVDEEERITRMRVFLREEDARAAAEQTS